MPEVECDCKCHAEYLSPCSACLNHDDRQEPRDSSEWGAEEWRKVALENLRMACAQSCRADRAEDEIAWVRSIVADDGQSSAARILLLNEGLATVSGGTWVCGRCGKEPAAHAFSACVYEPRFRPEGGQS